MTEVEQKLSMHLCAEMTEPLPFWASNLRFPCAPEFSREQHGWDWWTDVTLRTWACMQLYVKMKKLSRMWLTWGDACGPQELSSPLEISPEFGFLLRRWLLLRRRAEARIDGLIWRYTLDHAALCENEEHWACNWENDMKASRNWADRDMKLSMHLLSVSAFSRHWHENWACIWENDMKVSRHWADTDI